MIFIGKAPYRVSLLGGSSDLDWFVRENGYGICLGFALNQYSYSVLNVLPSNAKRGILDYSTREIYSSINNLFKENKYLEFGKAAKQNSQNFHWNMIIESYKKRMESIGSRCDLILYEGAEHAFFNRGDDFIDTVFQTDIFLKSNGYLLGPPTIK